MLSLFSYSAHPHRLRKAARAFLWHRHLSGTVGKWDQVSGFPWLLWGLAVPYRALVIGDFCVTFLELEGAQKNRKSEFQWSCCVLGAVLWRDDKSRSEWGWDQWWMQHESQVGRTGHGHAQNCSHTFETIILWSLRVWWESRKICVQTLQRMWCLVICDQYSSQFFKKSRPLP